MQPIIKSPKTPKAAKTPKARPVVLSCLAATILGRARVGGVAVSAHSLSLSFPAFNEQELENALAELLDKNLITKKREDYSLTDIGRQSSISVD